MSGAAGSAALFPVLKALGFLRSYSEPIAFLSTPVSGISTTETIVLQGLIPAGRLRTGGFISVDYLSLSKSGVVGTLLFTARVGTAGTTADTPLTGYTALNVSTAAQSAGVFSAFKLVSPTSILPLGRTGSPLFTGTAATLQVATTVSSFSSNAMYVSIGLNTGSVDTCGIQSGVITIHQPLP